MWIAITLFTWVILVPLSFVVDRVADKHEARKMHRINPRVFPDPDNGKKQNKLWTDEQVVGGKLILAEGEIKIREQLRSVIDDEFISVGDFVIDKNYSNKDVYKVLKVGNAKHNMEIYIDNIPEGSNYRNRYALLQNILTGEIHIGSFWNFIKCTESGKRIIDHSSWTDNKIKAICKMSGAEKPGYKLYMFVMKYAERKHYQTMKCKDGSEICSRIFLG